MQLVVVRSSSLSLPLALLLVGALVPKGPAAAACDSVQGLAEGRRQIVRLILDDQPALARTLLEECRARAEARSLSDKFRACLGRSEQLVELYLRRGENGLGLSRPDGSPLSNADYLRGNREALGIPDWLASAEVTAALAAVRLQARATVEAAQKAIEAAAAQQGVKEVKVAPFVSQFMAASDTTADPYGRLLVWFNQSGSSHYVQLSVAAQEPDSRAPREERALASSFTVVFDGAAAGSYAIELSRNAAEHRFELKGKPANDQHCYACHAAGPLALHPLGSSTVEQAPARRSLQSTGWLDSFNAVFKQQVAAMNQQILRDRHEAEQRKLSMIGDPAANGLVRGIEVPLPNPWAMKGRSAPCRAALRALEPPKAPHLEPRPPARRGPSSCEACHSGIWRSGPPGFTLVSRSELEPMAEMYVGGGLMPPVAEEYTDEYRGVVSDLPLDRRWQASECFSASYFGGKVLGIGDQPSWEIGPQHSLLGRWLSPRCE